MSALSNQLQFSPKRWAPGRSKCFFCVGKIQNAAISIFCQDAFVTQIKILRRSFLWFPANAERNARLT